IQGKLAFTKGHNLWIYAGDQAQQLTSLGSVQNPAWSPDGGRLAFDRAGKNSADLYVMTVPGGLPQALTANSSPVVENNFWEMQPAWSSDGRSLVYASDRGRLRTGTLDLAVWRMTLATKVRAQLSSANLYTGGVDYPSVRPGGDDIVFTSWTYQPETLEPYGALMWQDAKNGAVSPLTASGETAFQASWAPDGVHLALVRRIGNRDQIWIATVLPPAPPATLRQIVPSSSSRIPASSRQPLPPAPTSGRPGENSDDGVAINSLATPVADGDGSQIEPSVLTTAGLIVDGVNAHPVWSPGGDAIAYIGLVDGSFDLFLQRLTPAFQASGSPERLTQGSHVDADSALSWAR
ncbi:MAG: PD40 domain-containing protein, partial [Chloroflexi bacterium]|nr:PD40 domain-containing protein [Chloroflexota bacterium]